MRLSKRIHAICDTIAVGETVADIGTDHGYVPMLLVRNNISPFVIMSDISDGSLNKAKETFAQCHITTNIGQFRQGDGLKCIEAGEVDDVIIGGLGGLTISEILASDMDKARSFKRFILQPRKHSGNLRHFLYVNGFDIEKEILTTEGKFVCEIICAVPTDKTHREELYPEKDIRWKYPQSLLECDSNLLNKRVSWKISSIDEEISNLKKSNKDVKEEILTLESDKKYLKGLIECQEN